MARFFRGEPLWDQLDVYCAKAVAKRWKLQEGHQYYEPLGHEGRPREGVCNPRLHVMGGKLYLPVSRDLQSKLAAGSERDMS